MFRSLVKRSLPALWVVSALFAIVAAASFATHKTFHVEIAIPASTDAVWAVLVDTEAYPQWNPVFVEVEGAYTEGETVLNKVRDPGGAVLEMTALVETVRPGAELRQSGGIPGILTFDHRWLLESIEGGTRVVQHEVDRGIGLWFVDTDWIEPAYSAANEALAKRVQLMAATRKRGAALGATVEMNDRVLIPDRGQRLDHLPRRVARELGE